MLNHAQLATLAADCYDRPPHWQDPANPQARACMDVYFGSPVVSVPGTDLHVPEDLLADLDCRAILVPGLGFVHEGFYAAASALYAKVQAEVFPAQEVIFVGHSSGGAIAAIMAALAQRDASVQSVQLVTFGCPRVGALQFAAQLLPVSKSLYRLGNDPVPDVPWILWQWPPVLLIHPAKLKRIGSPAKEPLSNHSISNYVDELTRLGL